MKILVMCLEGNNRSVTLAHQLKYLDHDVLTGGFNTNDPTTVIMLAEWADLVILTEQDQIIPMQMALDLGGVETEHVSLWDIGPDIYPRPFNKELLAICKRLVAEHREELK